MAMTKEQVAAFRAQAIADNIEVVARLAPAVEAVSHAVNQAIIIADELHVVDVDDWLRVRDTLISAGANFKNNLDHVVRPILAAYAKPATGEGEGA